MQEPPMRALLFLFSIFLIPLFADPKDPYLLAVTEGEPSALVAGCVNAITGDLYLAEEDVLVQGYVPLRLPRHYISGDGMGTLVGWSFLDHLEAKYKGGETEHQIKIQDPNGSTYTFRCPAEDVLGHFEKKKHPPKFRPPPPEETLGLTNAAQGEISGRNNLKNASIRLEEKGKYFTVYCPDQTTRRYKIHGAKKNFKAVFKGEVERKIKYLLESETLSSGHKVVYHYDDEDRVDHIRTTNPSGTKNYAFASFHYLHRHRHNGPDVDITLSDGRTLRYRFESKHQGKVFLLRSITSPESPEENLYYHSQGHHFGNLISRMTEPDLRFLDVEYYHIGHNNIGGADVKVSDKHDPKFLRVKTLKAPVGHDATGHITHRFFYDPNNHYTDVRQIDNTLTRYHYGAAMRLSAIERFGHNDALNQKEIFEWSNNGDLRSRSLFDSRGNLLFSRRLHYDNRGNVTREDLCGDLSGNGNTQEVYTIQREYSQDNRDLLLKEQEQNGKTVLYTYIPNTNLLCARLVCQGDKIQTRTFYEYNSDHVLIKEICDDGTTQNKDDLSGVKTRTIKAITPMPDGPFIDMPYIIAEKYWDGQKEQLLKKTRLTYTTGGHVEKQEVYDALRTLSYTLNYQYDSLGRIIQETDALGQISLYIYDAAGNKITSSTPGGRRIGAITYDHSNRPRQLEECGFDGIAHTTHYAYDGKNRKVAETNSLGNTTRYVYDALDHLIETHLPQVLDERGEPSSPVILSSYDGMGREVGRTDAKGNTIQTRYNARSQVTCIRYPDGSQERFFYNLDGTLKAYIDKEGAATFHTYDSLGRRTSTTDSNGNTTQFLYDSFHLIAIVDAEGYATNYAYDGAGRKIAEERSGERITYGYDSLNRLHSVTKGDLITLTEYDLLDRAIEERQEDSQGNLLFKVTYTYDAAGNRSSVTRYEAGKQRTDLFTYDAFDRLIVHQDPLGYQTQITYDMSHLNTLSQRVLQKTTTDPLGQKLIETHDSLDRIVQIQIESPGGSALSKRNTTILTTTSLCKSAPSFRNRHSGALLGNMIISIACLPSLSPKVKSPATPTPPTGV